MDNAKVFRERPQKLMFSEREVFVDDIQRVMPAGYRQVYVKEIASLFFHNAEFREELRTAGAVWTADKGTKNMGVFRINAEGLFLPTNKEEVRSLPEGHYSAHYPGIGQVIVRCYNCYDKIGMYIDAEYKPSKTAKVAYVKDENAKPDHQNKTTVAIPAEEINAVKESLKAVEASIKRMPHTSELIVFISNVKELLRDRT
jgi:hypothetical protein